MIIKVYGEYWSRDRVDWTKRALHGVRRGKSPCNIWEQRGIYALYKDFDLAYVGKADTRGIGTRLSEHRGDRFAERWNAFSFFGICELDADGNAKPPRDVRVAPASMVKSLELLAILLSDAPLNRARGKFPDGAQKVWQASPSDQSKAFTLQGQLIQIEQQIAKLRSSLDAKQRNIKHKFSEE